MSDYKARTRTISPDLSIGSGDAGSDSPQTASRYNLGWAARVARRNATFICQVTGIVFALAVAYLAVAKPQYTATGELIFDLRESKILSANPILQNIGAMDQYVIDSQVEVIRSSSVARRVIMQLGLRKPPASSAASFWRTLLPFGTQAVQPPAYDAITQGEYDAFLKRLNARRKGLTFVILVSYSDPDPLKAAAITNAIMEAYTAEQRRVKVETISAANSWLEQRVDELRQKVIESERRVQQFKTEDAAIDAKVMNSIYGSFLTRLKETQSQEALQTSDARIVSTAVAPDHPSSPKTGLTLAIALALGLASGTLIALGRAAFDPVLQDPTDAIAATGLPLLAALPAKSEGATDGAYDQAIFALRQSVADAGALDSHKIVAVFSARSGDGKTSTAIDFAREAAAGGIRTLLIDADLRTATATARIAPDHKGASLIDVVEGRSKIADALATDSASPLMLCPAPTGHSAAQRPTAALASRAFTKLTRDLRKDFDLIVVDTPAFLDFQDARCILPVLDRIVVVAAMGRTSRQDLAKLNAAMAHFPVGHAGLALIAAPADGEVKSAGFSLAGLRAMLAARLRPMPAA